MSSNRTKARGGMFANVGKLTLRRISRDRWLVVAAAAIVAVASFLTYAAPFLVQEVIDKGAADTVSGAEEQTAIHMRMPVGNTFGDNVSSVRGTDPTRYDSLVQSILENLPGPITERIGSIDKRMTGRLQLASVSTAAAVEKATDEGKNLYLAEKSGRAADYLDLVSSEHAELTVVEGREPVVVPASDEVLSGLASPDPIEIALSKEAMDTLELELGGLIFVNSQMNPNRHMALHIVGVVEAADPSNPFWQDYPTFTEPAVSDNAAQALSRGSVLVTSPEGIREITNDTRVPVNGNLTLAISPDGITLDNLSELEDAVEALLNPATSPLPQSATMLKVETQLHTVLASYPAQAQSALAHLSVVLAGVVAVAAVAIALMARLQMSRRETDIALERARGSSLSSIALRLFLESLVIAVLGVGIGYLGAYLWLGIDDWLNSLAVGVFAVGLLSLPILGWRHARGMWSGKRQAANRQDRAKLVKLQKARRTTFELLALVVGAAAVVSLRERGVLEGSDSGVDFFLAATPVLVALAATVLVLRLYPIPMAIVQFFAKRTRGVAGVLALAKARQKIPVLPLVALTIAVSVGVTGGLLVSTVESGQEQASHERIGADVRISGSVDQEALDQWTAQGLTVSRALYRPDSVLNLGSNSAYMTLLAVDQNYSAIVQEFMPSSEVEALLAAIAATKPGDPVPAIASQELLDLQVGRRTELFIGRGLIPLTLSGVATQTPDGWASGPYLITDLDTVLNSELETPQEINTYFVSGPQAAEIVQSAELPDAQVLTRVAWLSGVQESALIGGISDLMALAVLAVGALAALALLTTILYGVRERGRALTMLRTQGMRAGFGWWLSLSELVPLVLAAIVGGSLASVTVMTLLGSSLGLEALTGGLHVPQPVADPQFLLYVGAGITALLLFTVATEVFAHRRNKLSEVLRYGESR